MRGKAEVEPMVMNEQWQRRSKAMSRDKTYRMIQFRNMRDTDIFEAGIIREYPRVESSSGYCSPEINEQRNEQPFPRMYQPGAGE